MRASEDRDAENTSADESAYTTEDAFAPGGEVRDAERHDEREAKESDARDDDAPDDVADAAARQRELNEQRDRYLRLAAEFDNFRRRTQKERLETGARAQAELVKPLLDALDDLDRFSQVDADSKTAATVIEGVVLVGKKLHKALAAAGLEIVDPADEPFDPSRHEAIATAPAASEEEDSTVSAVYQPGYLFAGHLLRPARVVVRQWNG